MPLPNVWRHGTGRKRRGWGKGWNLTLGRAEVNTLSLRFERKVEVDVVDDLRGRLQKKSLGLIDV